MTFLWFNNYLNYVILLISLVHPHRNSHAHTTEHLWEKKTCQAAFVFLCCCCGEREATDQSWQTALVGPEVTWIFIRFITLFYFLASPLFILHFHCLNSIKHFRRAGWLDWGRCKHTPTGKDKCVFTRTSASGLMTRCHDRREPKLRWTFSPLRASWDLPATHSN